LRSAAIEAIGGQLVRTSYAQGGHEQTVYLPVFLLYNCGGVCSGPMVTHLHVAARPGTRRIVEALGLKPAVMIRSISDMLASLWDMLLAEPAAARVLTHSGLPQSRERCAAR
jgi:hypothetical protein